MSPAWKRSRWSARRSPPVLGAVTLAVAIALVAAGCRGGAGSGPADPDRAPGEVRVAVGEDIWPLTGVGPSSHHFAAGELNVGVYEPLVSLAPDFTVRPGLAERWEQLDGGAWRFHLRPGVTFHDGRPFGADDVVWSWTSRVGYPRSVTSVLGPGTVVKVDDRTVDFRPTTPDSRLPEQLVHPEGPIVPSGGHNDADPPVGTGPYRVVEYRPRQRVVLDRYPQYWGPKATVPRLTFLFMPEPADRVKALRSGAVDVAALPNEDAADLIGEPGIRVVRAPLGAVQQLSFNVTARAGGTTTPSTPPSEVAGDPAVRQAVSLALDRQAYVAEVLGGSGEPGRWMAPSAVLGDSAGLVPAPVHDLAQAVQVLEAAGWVVGPDGVRARAGRRLSLTLLGGPLVPEGGLTYVRAGLRPAGIEVVVKRAADTVTINEYRQRGYDLELTMPNQNDANPAFLTGLRTGADAGAEAELAARGAAALAAPTRQEAQRAAAQAMRVLVAEQRVIVPLATVARAYGTRDGFSLGELHPSAINQSWAGLSGPAGTTSRP